MKNKEIRKIANMAMLLALDVLLTRILAINTPVVKIGFGFLSTAVCGVMYGPLCAAIVAALGDFIGSMVFPTGAYYFGFTLSSALTGVVFGLLLKNYSSRKGIIAAIVNVVVIVYLINTAFIAHITGTAYSAMLITRSVSSLILLVIQTATLSLVLPKLMNFIKKQA